MNLLGLACAAILFATACSGSADSIPAAGNDSTPTSQTSGEPAVDDTTAPESTSPEPTTSQPELPVMVSIQDLVATGVTTEQARCYVNAGDPAGTGFVTNPDAALEAFGSCLLTNPPQPPGGTDG